MRQRGVRGDDASVEGSRETRARARARAKDESDDEGLAIALGMGVGMKFARGDGGGEDDRRADGVLATMDRLGSGARAKARRDEALIAEARALGRAEEEEDEEDEEEAPRELALAEAANAQGSRALQILKMNPEVRNAVAEQMFLPAIHKSLAPKIRTEMKTSLFRPKLPAWAQTKKEHLEITGSGGGAEGSGRESEVPVGRACDVRIHR